MSLSALQRKSLGLGPARSITQPLEWIDQLASPMADAESRRLERTAESNEEALFLLSLEGNDTLDQWLSLDRRIARISVESAKEPQTRRNEIIRTVKARLSDLSADGWSSNLTGPLVVAHDLVEEVQRTQIRSLGSAIAVVLVLVMLFLRSPGWALLAMVPTTLPVFMTLGAMGIAGISLDVGTAMVSAVVIGIAVDDTVHLLYHYRTHLDQGEVHSSAIEMAMLDVGQPVITTSAALTLGLFALTLSPWQSVASFGFLSGIAIVGALVADLSVLPALIILADRTQRWRR